MMLVRIVLLALRFLAVLLPVVEAAAAETSVSSKAARAFASECPKYRKSQKLCRCITQDLMKKLEVHALSEDQVELALSVLKGTAPADPEKAAYVDSVADLLAGIEQQCNP